MESNLVESDDYNKVDGGEHQDDSIVLSEEGESKILDPESYSNEYYGMFSPSINSSWNGRKDICTIPDLLFARQTFGTSTTYQTLLPTRFRVSSRYNDHLASRIAWCPERMRNMILSVGPNTPASFCWRDDTTITGGDGESNDDNVDASDMDDDSDDDDDTDNNSNSDGNDNNSPDDDNDEEEDDNDSGVVMEEGQDEEAVARWAVGTALAESLASAIFSNNTPNEDTTTTPSDQPGVNNSVAQSNNNDDQNENNKDDNNSREETILDAAKRPEEGVNNTSEEMNSEENTASERNENENTIEHGPILPNSDPQQVQTTSSTLPPSSDVPSSSQPTERRAQFNEAQRRAAMRLIRRHITITAQDNSISVTLGQTARSSASSSSSSDDDENESPVRINRVMRVDANRNNQRDNDEDNDGSDDENDEDDDDDDGIPFLRMLASHGFEASFRGQSASTDRGNRSRRKGFLPSIRHSGCINTACWLTCPWRLSTYDNNSLSANEITRNSVSFLHSNECPTQIVTSGDDKLIKFWDVRYALGSASPLPGGYDTFNPLAYYKTEPSMDIGKQWRTEHRRRIIASNNDDAIGSDEIINRQHSARSAIHGEVRELASIHTFHRGNVFHITPVDERPGQVVSCGADGYLRLVNLEKEESSVVIMPFIPGEDSDDDDMASFFIHTGMAFSHVLLTSNTGLLCSERGLHHFDLRVSPRQQQRQSFFQSSKHRQDGLHGSTRFRPVSCKACTIWSPNGIDSSDPTYVFAGGASSVVELFDIRMCSSNDSQRKVVQRYCPRQLNGQSGNISVSGLDVTKDGKELLVSYEVDQIYTFPILQNMTSCQAGLTVDEIDTACEASTNNPDLYVSEKAAYGGHLNRFTFLKNPKYAGPNDEYICTGSDSGHAWIYNKHTGTVASLIGADASTCNGVIPHPTLPFFITYGIASTAKIWRAAPPVDPTIDNSPSGKRRALLSNSVHELSPVTKQWDGVQQILKRFERTDSCTMPDFIASSDEMGACSRFSSRTMRKIAGPNSPAVGNALRYLPIVLRQNRYECYRARHDDRRDSGPIRQPLKEFSHRVAISRLKFQADSLGARWNQLYPWVFHLPLCDESTSLFHPADLIPDNPSDWILFDRKMSTDPIDASMNFNSTDYPYSLTKHSENTDSMSESEAIFNTTPWLSDDQRSIDNYTDSLWPTLEHDEANDFEKQSRKLLLETVIVLKEGGNAAMKKNSFMLALKHYDKAVQYCAVALMQYTEGSTSLQHLTKGHSKSIGHPVTSVIAVWSPLLHLLITTRLNLSLLLLKPDIGSPNRAADQAREALKLLAPFTRQEGNVVCFLRRKMHVISNEETKETYQDARALQAKAYFRLGSAELEMQEYGGAVKSFELSLKSSKTDSPNQKPDSLLVKRLREAKRMHSNKKIRDRRRYERMVAED